LQRMLDELQSGMAGTPLPAGQRAESAPYLKPSTTKKGAPLKSLGALDQLFRK